MRIWIRSQNKKELIECNNFSLNSPNESYVNNSRQITNYEIVCYPFEHSHCVLGKYSTKEKALKVIDGITSWINDLEYVRNIKSYRNIFIYQMPQDDEVEE